VGKEALNQRLLDDLAKSSTVAREGNAAEPVVDHSPQPSPLERLTDRQGGQGQGHPPWRAARRGGGAGRSTLGSHVVGKNCG